MPPVVVRKDEPIRAANADGVTPKTASDVSSSYPAAAPAAAPAPAPTGGAVNRAPDLVFHPTRTTQASSSQDGPPPPQPGAVPIPPTRTFADTSREPAPPQPGSVPATTAPAQVPPQFSIPAPTGTQAPTHSTVPSATSSHSQPTTLDFGPVSTSRVPTSSVPETGERRSLEHPPGYVQNPYAAEGTANQRAALDSAAAANRNEGSGILGAIGGAGSGNPSGFGGAAQGDSSRDGGVWDTFKGWASNAGKEAARLEEEAWKRINGK